MGIKFVFSNVVTCTGFSPNQTHPIVNIYLTDKIHNCIYCGQKFKLISAIDTSNS